MRKVVYNKCYGGFGLSDEAIELYLQKKGLYYKKKGVRHYSVDGDFFEEDDIKRHDPILVAVVEELGSKANDSCSELDIQEVSGLYRIEEYDGKETVVEDYSDWQ